MVFLEISNVPLGMVFAEIVTNIVINVLYIFAIMLALCLMLSITHHAQNHAGIIGGSLVIAACLAGQEARHAKILTYSHKLSRA